MIVFFDIIFASLKMSYFAIGLAICIA